MKLTPLASNMTEMEIGPVTLLFSYSTPVAGFRPVHGPNESGHFKTAKWYSQTTTRHIKKYFRDEWDIDSDTVREIDQERIDRMLWAKMYDYDKLEWIHCAIQEAQNGDDSCLEKAIEFVEDLREPYLEAVK